MLGYVVCKEGIKVKFSKIKVILDLKPPINPKQVRILLSHTGYYIKFIRYYYDMTYPLEELLKDHQEFIWSQECVESFKLLIQKHVKAPIPRFPNWSIRFHVHINTSRITVSAILTQPREDGMDYPNAHVSRKLNKAEKNYSTTEREAPYKNICIIY